MKSFITHYRIYLILLVQTNLLIMLNACSNEDKTIKSWLKKEMILPEVTSDELKIVTRFEADCPACIESIALWKIFVESIRNKNEKIKFVFYVETLREDTFNNIKEQLDFIDIVIFDQQASFLKNNLLNFPYGLEYQTFLLDETNHIIILGNPILKKKLIKKYIAKV